MPTENEGHFFRSALLPLPDLAGERGRTPLATFNIEQDQGSTRTERAYDALALLFDAFDRPARPAFA